MAYDRYLIAPFDSGLEKSGNKWLIPEDAYLRVDNAWVYRGKLTKRFGSRYMGGDVSKSRLRINLANLGAGGTTSGVGNAAGTVPVNTIAGNKGHIGQQFAIGNYVYTVIDDTAGLQDMLSTGGAATAQYNCDTGAYSFTGATPLTDIFFYPSYPVMGLYNYEIGDVNNHPAYGFDTHFVYRYAGSGWDWAHGATTDAIFKGANYKFFWATNWFGTTQATVLPLPYLFASNYNATIGPVLAGDTSDSMYYWSGTDWAVFQPTLVEGAVAPNVNRYVKSAKILLPFKQRFVLLSTIENDGINPAGFGSKNTAYTNRCRYSAPGSPIDNAGYNWLEVDEPHYRGGGWTDAATSEAIIGARFIRDRLIVSFERSTWELAFTGNNARPFIWQKLNAEVGAMATNSVVPFDKAILLIDKTGIQACNGVGIERIDTKIYSDIFDVRTTENGPERISGIRDFQAEAVYWSWPTKNQASYANIYPARVLVYNYQNDTWSYNDDVITTWGYFEQDAADIWATDTEKWEDDKTTWAAGVTHASNKEVIAGNQQGFVFIVDKDVPYNAAVLSITKASYALGTLVLTIIDHTMTIDDYIYIPTLNGMTLTGNGIYKITAVTSKDVVVIDVTDLVVAGTYIGNSYAARISRLDVLSKQWNPYINQAANFIIYKIDFCVQSTVSGRLTVDYSPNSGLLADGNPISMIDAGVATNSALGSNILETSPYALVNLESLQERLWHPVYFQTQGNCIQIRMYYSDVEMEDPNIWNQPFTLEGLVLYTKLASGRLE